MHKKIQKRLLQSLSRCSMNEELLLGCVYIYLMMLFWGGRGRGQFKSLVSLVSLKITTQAKSNISNTKESSHLIYLHLQYSNEYSLTLEKGNMI